MEDSTINLRKTIKITKKLKAIEQSFNTISCLFSQSNKVISTAPFTVSQQIICKINRNKIDQSLINTLKNKQLINYAKKHRTTYSTLLLKEIKKQNNKLKMLEIENSILKELYFKNCICSGNVCTLHKYSKCKVKNKKTRKISKKNRATQLNILNSQKQQPNISSVTNIDDINIPHIETISIFEDEAPPKEIIIPSLAPISILNDSQLKTNLVIVSPVKTNLVSTKNDSNNLKSNVVQTNPNKTMATDETANIFKIPENVFSIDNKPKLKKKTKNIKEKCFEKKADIKNNSQNNDITEENELHIVINKPEVKDISFTTLNNKTIKRKSSKRNKKELSEIIDENPADLNKSNKIQETIDNLSESEFKQPEIPVKAEKSNNFNMDMNKTNESNENMANLSIYTLMELSQNELDDKAHTETCKRVELWKKYGSPWIDEYSDIEHQSVDIIFKDSSTCESIQKKSKRTTVQHLINNCIQSTWQSPNLSPIPKPEP